MAKRTSLCLVFLTFTLLAYCQLNRKDVKNVFSEFLNNSFNGKYAGWSSYPNDSLRLDPTDYEDKVNSFKKTFRLAQTDNCFYAKAYGIDSLRVWSDFAFGYVTLEAVSYGYVLDRLYIGPQKINKTYLLITKNLNWYVLSETEDWFVSASSYIKWAEKYLSDKTRKEGHKYEDNVTNNLRDFKEYFKIPR
jgi:hypothetical protein